MKQPILILAAMGFGFGLAYGLTSHRPATPTAPHWLQQAESEMEPVAVASRRAHRPDSRTQFYSARAAHDSLDAELDLDSDELARLEAEGTARLAEAKAKKASAEGGEHSEIKATGQAKSGSPDSSDEDESEESEEEGSDTVEAHRWESDANTPAEITSPEDVASDSGNQGGAYWVGGYAGTPGANPLDPTADQANRSLEQWLDLLLIQPNFTLVNQFTELYLSKTIDDATFYGVIKAMLSDDRFDMKKYAVIALSNVPSTESFMELVGVLQSSITSAELAGLVRNKLESVYAFQSKNFKVLAQVIRASASGQGSSDHVQEIALDLVDRALERAVNQTSSNNPEALSAMARGDWQLLFDALYEVRDQISGADQLLQEIESFLA